MAKKDFSAVFFRKTTVQVRNPGGLWDASMKVYPYFGGRPISHRLEWVWPNGGRIRFAHLEHSTNVLDWQGAEVPLIVYDELTHFDSASFWYLLSRNRSTSGVKPYVRASCNPDADSWVADLIAWWINQDTGLPIPERAGVLRWFVRVNDALVWADTREELEARFPDTPPKSLTFIPAKLTDNLALMRADPGYRANLLALPTVERERLLGGNWKIRPAAGLYFQRSWCRVVDAVPAGLKIVRGWDLAATPKTEGNDPDSTDSVKIGRTDDGRYYVMHHSTLHGSPAEVDAALKNTAEADGQGVDIHIPQDPGAAGKALVAHHAKLLAGYVVRFSPETGDKITRFGPFSAQAQAGNVYVVRGGWNEGWFDALEGFPTMKHDDAVDATSRAFNAHLSQMKGEGMFALAQRQAAQAAAAKDAPEMAQPTHAPGSVEHTMALMMGRT